jgi:hypothetical protein
MRFCGSPRIRFPQITAGRGWGRPRHAGRRGVLLIAAESVERLGENHVDTPVQRIAHQGLETRAKKRSRQTLRDPSTRPRSSNLDAPRTRGRREVDLRWTHHADCPRRVSRADADPSQGSPTSDGCYSIDVWSNASILEVGAEFPSTTGIFLGRLHWNVTDSLKEPRRWGSLEVARLLLWSGAIERVR